MKRIALAFALFVVNNTVMAESWLDINLTSDHSMGYYIQNGKRHTYNEHNYGFGITNELTDNLDFRAGVFENSFYRTSFYGAVNLKKEFGNDIKIVPGINIGLVSGYKGTIESNSTLRTMVIPNMSIQVFYFRANVGYIPSTLVKPDGVNVTFFQVGWKFK